jgi:hypothetical protein
MSQFDRIEDDHHPNGERYPDLQGMLKEPDARITVRRHELLELLIEADEALDGDSNDDEHDALYSLRESLAGFLEDPSRR